MSEDLKCPLSIIGNSKHRLLAKSGMPLTGNFLMYLNLLVNGRSVQQTQNNEKEMTSVFEGPVYSSHISTNLVEAYLSTA